MFSAPLPFIFVDFKAGHSESADGKLRWTPRQLKAGINNGVPLEDALKDDMPIKLDFVIEIDGQFVEVSEIYTTKYQTKKPLKQVEDELEADVAHYAKENNSMKALKRFFSLLMLHSGHDRVKKELILFFNSEVGLANKICNVPSPAPRHRRRCGPLQHLERGTTARHAPRGRRHGHSPLPLRRGLQQRHLRTCPGAPRTGTRSSQPDLHVHPRAPATWPTMVG